jgi:imidazolonepropionase-like amidohydrolase
MAEAITVWKGGRLIDGNGIPPLEDSLIVARGERIDGVGRSSELTVPEGALVIDVTGKTVMPGMIDAHIHFMGWRTPDQARNLLDEPHVQSMRSVIDAWRLLDAGFTAVRDMGGMNAIYLKRAIQDGSIVGPRIMAAGRAISQTAGHADAHGIPPEWWKRHLMGRVADGVADVRKAAREQLREGADLLKIMTTGGVMSEKDKPTACHYSMEEIHAFAEEARNWGVKTGTHAQGTQGIKNALIAGIDSIEHGIFLDDECIEMMLEQGTQLVPTLAIVDAIVTKGRKLGVSGGSVSKAESVQDVHLASFIKAYRAGVKCGLGTDYLSDRVMSPHGENAIELEIYVNKAGLSPMEAIVCATRNNAEVLDLQDDVGTLESGKLADLIVVDGDPLQDISVLQDRSKIAAVYKGGQLVPRLSL